MANCRESGIEKPVFDSYIDPEKGQQMFVVIYRREEALRASSFEETYTTYLPKRVVGRILGFITDPKEYEEGLAFILFNGEEVQVRTAPLEKREEQRVLNILREIKIRNDAALSEGMRHKARLFS